MEAVTILEKDKNNDVLVAWTYPALPSDDLEPVIISRSNLKEEAIPLQFSFSKFKDFWIYIFTQSKDEGNTTLPSVTVYSIVLLTKSFNPEKYASFLKIASTLYGAGGSPLTVLKGYLSVFATGEFDAKDYGKYVESDFDVRQAYLVTSIKDIVRMFGAEVILIWSALLMKKRIAVYAEKLGILLRVIRSFPLFVVHRQDWNILRPYVTLTDGELQELKTTGVYCAGFTDYSVVAKEDIYDLFVDVNQRSIVVPEHSKAHFVMGSFHKEIATFLVESCETDEIADQAIVKNLTTKTRDILQKLQTLTATAQDGTAYLTMEILQAKKLPVHLQKFLFAVASAEGLAKDTQTKAE